MAVVSRIPIATVALVIASFIGIVASASQAPARPPDRPWLVAHRGASAYSPENTVPAFVLAAEQGATFVEFDLQLTKDRRVVCLHDNSLERTTDVEAVFPDRARTAPSGARTWMLEDFTLDEIKRLDAGAWLDAKYRGTRIPTFGETIDALRGRSGLFIEVKSPERYKGIERLIMAELKARGLDRPGAEPRTPVLIQSFSADSLKIFKDELQTDAADSLSVRRARCGAVGDRRGPVAHQGILHRHQSGKGDRRGASGGDGARQENGAADHPIHLPRKRGGRRLRGRQRRDAALPADAEGGWGDHRQPGQDAAVTQSASSPVVRRQKGTGNWRTGDCSLYLKNLFA